MAWTYVILGSSGRYYFGSTTDLARRLEQHRSGHTHSTRRLGETLTLVGSVEFANLPEARAFERAMKRKKNPKLALVLLEQKKKELSG